MASHQGFSLTEVLVSLLLISSTSLAFLYQQWQLCRILNQTIADSYALEQRNNNRERMQKDEKIEPTKIEQSND
jgi:prepilin-type N-terminal cleavage/methylation domain-containing protein